MGHQVFTRISLLGLLGVCLLWASATASANAVRILYDEDAASQWTQLERAEALPEAAHTGEQGVRITPTYWHNPLLRLPGRTDFRPYDQLEFDIRATEGVMDTRFWGWDYAESTRVTLSDYVEGGVIDTEWRRITIPLNALASEAFPLDKVFVLIFERMDEPQSFDIDNMLLRITRGPVIKGAVMRSLRAVTVLVDEADHANLENVTFSISSTTDPNYQQAQEPVGLGSSRQAIDANEQGSIEKESRLHLLLPQALADGHTYQIQIDGLTNEAGNPPKQNTLEFTVDVEAVSPSIQVNQEGYAPNAPKLAYVGNWLGDFGPMPVDETMFQLIDTSTGNNVYEGTLSLRVANDVQSGSDLYEADFSSFTTPGNYRLEVPGIGRSYDFEIGNQIYDNVYRTVARFLYHKRNTELVAPYADPGFERAGIDPQLDGVFHPILATYPLSVGETAFDYKPIQGGWFDAGDYGLYIHNAAPIWGAIGVAFDLVADGHFADNELNIPESGNGIPDLLDELGWGMDWAMSMQDTDGGVYWRLASGSWDTVLPGDVSEPRLIYEKTTRATAQFAAMGAIYSRLIRPYDSERADTVLAAARQAWQFVQTHEVYPEEGTNYQNPDELPGGGEYPGSSLPAQFWAAAELYRVTGEIGFQDSYRTLKASFNFDVSAAPYATFAPWAMMMSNHANQDMILKELARQTIMFAAKLKMDWSDQHPYRVAKHPHIPYSGWHSVSGGAMQALTLLQAYYLSGTEKYAEAAWMMPNVTLGANPLSQTFITGVGIKPTRDPLDRISLLDEVDEPIRGMPIPGFTWHLPGFREPYIGVNAAYYPAEQPATSGDYANAFPVMRRYIDSHALIPMSEGTIREAGVTAVAFGLLRDEAKPVQVTATPYHWTGRLGVYSLSHIPLADVPRLTPVQITEFGASVGETPTAWVQALTGEQVAAIDASNGYYWVARLTPQQQNYLTAAQIAAFTQFKLFQALLPSKVPLIPPEKIAFIGNALRQTSTEWRAALTPAQMAVISEEHSDNDGMPYLWEVQHGLNPWSSSDAGLDSDGDGLTNLEEFQQGTDPREVDTDGDGVSDKAEVEAGTDPLTADKGTSKNPPILAN